MTILRRHTASLLRSEPEPGFHLIYPDDSSEMQGVLKGEGVLSVGRVSDIWLPDGNGQHNQFLGGEIGYRGGSVSGAPGSRAVSAVEGEELPYVVRAPQSTNYFLNSNAPVNQTISGLSGNHTFSCIGNGTVTITGGVTNVISEGSPVTADPGGSDVTFSISGPPDSVQVEPGDSVTPPIPTAGSSVTRDADDYYFDSANWSDTEGSVYLEADVSGTAMLVDGLLDIANGFVGLTDGTVTVRGASLVEGACQIGWVYGPSGMRLCVDGTWTQTVPYDGGMLQGIFDLYRSAAVVGGMRNIQGIAKANEQWVTDKMPTPADYGDDFVMVVQTTAPGETFTLPCGNTGTYNAVIDWGDGSADSSITSYNDADLVHAYADAGKHTMRVSGTLPWIHFNNGGDKDKVIAILNGGSIGSLSASSMLNGCANLVVADLSNFDTAAVTSMESMFHSCSSLATLDLSSFDTAAVTSMLGMFYSCSSLTALDLSSFDTAAVTSMSYMLFSCSSLTALDVSSFDTAAVTNMGNMFYSCSSLTALDVSSFDTAAVTNMGLMFHSCSSLATLDLSSFDTAAVASMSTMFQGCSSLTALDLSNFDTAAVTNMGPMFQGCSSLITLDLSGFDTAAVTTMASMFFSCSSLTALDLSSFDTAAVTNMSSMFTGCQNVTTESMDGFLSALYASRMATAWATPVVDISPCNAPSGTYQDATPPTTGEEFRYKIENDPDGEGFNTWVVTV